MDMEASASPSRIPTPKGSSTGGTTKGSGKLEPMLNRSIAPTLLRSPVSRSGRAPPPISGANPSRISPSRSRKVDGKDSSKPLRTSIHAKTKAGKTVTSKKSIHVYEKENSSVTDMDSSPGHSLNEIGKEEKVAVIEKEKHVMSGVLKNNGESDEKKVEHEQHLEGFSACTELAIGRPSSDNSEEEQAIQKSSSESDSESGLLVLQKDIEEGYKKLKLLSEITLEQLKVKSRAAVDDVRSGIEQLVDSLEGHTLIMTDWETQRRHAAGWRTWPELQSFGEPDTWTVSEVSIWLHGVGFGFLAPKFELNEIDGPILLTLSEHDIRCEHDDNGESVNGSSLTPVSSPKVRRHRAPSFVSSPPLCPKKFCLGLKRIADARRLECLLDDLLPSRTKQLDSVFGSSVASMSLSSLVPHTRPIRIIRTKLIISALFALSAVVTASIMMVVVHFRLPDPSRFPPLPDVFLDTVPRVEWAFPLFEYIVGVMIIVNSMLMFLHRYRVIALSRLCVILGTVFYLRSVTIWVTGLSVPDTRFSEECTTNPDEMVSVEQKMQMAWNIMSGMGSFLIGHSSILTILCYFFIEYSPENWKGLHKLIWMVNIGGLFLVLLSHEHYSIDVVIAFYVSSRAFVTYHSFLRNLKANPMHNQTGVMKIEMPIPLFEYVEEYTGGVLPREYMWPWKN